ncbi:MAG: aminotransferase class V-fold PLP-dependent enzyme [candidate division Zixibacteria bacterium]|nr:aminotransferase class V-fold PLP-dependent enzyme [candidate division Zixibacteria bacterium]
MSRTAVSSEKSKLRKTGNGADTSTDEIPVAQSIDELNTLLRKTGPAVDNERFWQTVRAQFALRSDSGNLYTNNGTIGIQPHLVLQSQLDVIRRSEVDPWSPWPSYCPSPQEARPKLAALLNVDASEIAFTRNSTESMNIVAIGLVLDPKDEILTTTHEHHGGWSCWQNRNEQFGNPIRKMDLYDPPQDEDELVRLFEAAIRPETKVLSFCHVTCSTTWRYPVAKICAMARQRGIITVVDGAQSVGMIPVDIREIGSDFYVSSTHKWLFTPKGTGFLHIRQDMQDRMRGGYFTHGALHTAGRFENHASQSPAPLVGFAMAVDFHQAIGTTLIEERGATMAGYLKKGLAAIPGVKLWTPMAPNLSAAMVSFSIPGMSSGDIGTPLRQRYKIDSRGLHEGGYHGLRLSCAIHNSYEEMNKVLEAITEIADKRC